MNPELSNNQASFKPLSLNPAVFRGVEAAGYASPRPVQAATIPAALKGRDVLGLAQTGTGKTAAFVLPILHRLITTKPRKGKGPRVLIVAPTRELAIQIDAETRELGKFTRTKVATVFGGVSPNAQIKALRARPDIVVACPGRLLDLVNQGYVNLSGVETLVLDEADHMFDMGFLPDIKRILALLPDKRQNLLFSATMPQEIRKLANRILVDAEVVELANSAPAETIAHALYPVANARKVALLEHLLGDDGFESAIVFSRTKHRAKRLAQQLSRNGHEAVALQGNMSQNQRERAMKGFRSGRYNILVATDIAARGIDVAGVSHVVNFDVPNTPEAYTHRIGRTGRSECTGRAYTLVLAEDAQLIRAIERRLGAKIERRTVEGFEASGADEPRYDHRTDGPKRNGRARTRSGASRGRTAKTGGRNGSTRRRAEEKTASSGAKASPGGKPKRVASKNAAEPREGASGKKSTAPRARKQKPRRPGADSAGKRSGAGRRRRRTVS